MQSEKVTQSETMEEKKVVIQDPVRDPKQDRRMTIILWIVMLIFIIFGIFGLYTILHQPPDVNPNKPYQGNVPAHVATQTYTFQPAATTFVVSTTAVAI